MPSASSFARCAVPPFVTTAIRSFFASALIVSAAPGSIVMCSTRP
jgi:hypothetical protein